MQALAASVSFCCCCCGDGQLRRQLGGLALGPTQCCWLHLALSPATLQTRGDDLIIEQREDAAGAPAAACTTAAAAAAPGAVESAPHLASFIPWRCEVSFNGSA